MVVCDSLLYISAMSSMNQHNKLGGGNLWIFIYISAMSDYDQQNNVGSGSLWFLSYISA